MLLEIQYYSGEKRRVTLHPAFFSKSPAKSDGLKHLFDISIEKRAMDFAYQCGYRPYKVIVTNGDKVSFKQTIPGNEPESKYKIEKIDQSTVVKQLKKDWKLKQQLLLLRS